MTHTCNPICRDNGANECKRNYPKEFCEATVFVYLYTMGRFISNIFKVDWGWKVSKISKRKWVQRQIRNPNVDQCWCYSLQQLPFAQVSLSYQCGSLCVDASHQVPVQVHLQRRRYGCAWAEVSTFCIWWSGTFSVNKVNIFLRHHIVIALYLPGHLGLLRQCGGCTSLQYPRGIRVCNVFVFILKESTTSYSRMMLLWRLSRSWLRERKPSS